MKCACGKDHSSSGEVILCQRRQINELKAQVTKLRKRCLSESEIDSFLAALAHEETLEKIDKMKDEKVKEMRDA